MLRPGDRVGERYEIIEQLGAGGMGTLWRAHHLELDIDVALKVVSARAATAGSLKRFKREAQSAAKLRSPNIVQVLDFGEFQGQPYLAMELLHGEDLSVRLARVGTLPFEACAKIIRDVAKALQVAHRAGIVHRDLKPANIFLEQVHDEEIVKILDFGVAKDLGAPIEPGSTTASGVVGSPAYMSPEQVWAQEVGPRSDVWALGVIAFELVTGKNPFSDETLAKIFERIIRDPVPKPSELRPGLPSTLDAFSERALARSPKDRIASAMELSDAFSAAIEGREPPPPRPSDPFALTDPDGASAKGAVTERRRGSVTARARSRRRAVWILGALVVIAGIALVFATQREQLTAIGPVATSSQVVAPPPPATPLDQTAMLPSRAVAAPAISPPAASSLASEPKLPAAARSKDTPASAQRALKAPPSASAGRWQQLDPKFGIPVEP